MGALRERIWRIRSQRWVRTRHIRSPDPLPDVRLRAVLTTWNEGDIIATTVRTALEQGCDAVHLIDNDSSDDTVERGVAAGASFEQTFTTAHFPERERMRLMHALVERVSRATGGPHVWWLHLDADELVTGPDGQSILDVLTALDRSVRVVGSRTFNHYPRRDAPWEPGVDPRTLVTNVHERTGTACRSGHWKHPLVRWDAVGPEALASHGFHVVSCADRMLEPRAAVVSHHYPYRNQSITKARLELLRPRLEGHEWAMSRREANFGAIYREAYEEVDTHDMVGPGQHFHPVADPPVQARS